MSKRKSDAGSSRQTPTENATHKRAATQPAAGPVTVQLHAAQAAHLTGAAQLTVESGAVWIFGRVLTPDAGAVDICADLRIGGPLAIEACNAGVHVPCVGDSTARIRLASKRYGGASPEALPPSDAAFDESVALRCSPQQQQQSFELVQSPVATAAAPLAGSAQPLDLCQEWRQAAAGLASRDTGAAELVIVVVGSKQTGKSTFARLLVNSLLNRAPLVAYLDTDCGQSEFTAPGLVSLSFLSGLVSGPPHQHQQQPARAHFVGDTSPQADPMLYVRSITSLLAWFRDYTAQQRSTGRWQAPPPLVINTHGWIKGAGLEMLLEVLAAARMSHLVQLQSVHCKRNLPGDASWAAAGAAQPFSHILLPAADALGTGTPGVHQVGNSVIINGNQSGKAISPVDSRALSWLAFARGCLDAQRLATSTPDSWDSGAFTATAVALASQPPFAALWRELSVQVLHCSVPPAELPCAINGAVVGLAVGPQQQQPLYYDTLNVPADAAPLPCLGLGIVRSLDIQAGLVYLLTPLSDVELQHVDVLQVGRLSLPPALLQAPGLQSPYLALFSLTTDASASRSMKSRGNLLRAVHQ